MVKHDLDALIVDEDTISPVGKWFSGLDKPKTKAKDPAKFSDSGDKRPGLMTSRPIWNK